MKVYGTYEAVNGFQGASADADELEVGHSPRKDARLGKFERQKLLRTEALLTSGYCPTVEKVSLPGTRVITG